MRIFLMVFGLAWASLAFGQQSSPAANPRSQAAPAGPMLASYVAVSVNGGKLPSTDQVTDPHGTRFLVEFDELVLAIRAQGQFRASLRYRQSLAEKGIAIRREPIQSMTVYGRYVAQGNTLRFIPDQKRGGKGIQILDGTFAAGRIDVPFWYRNGQVSRKAQVVLQRDPSRF
ncbi:MAG: hypothetical protein Q8K55_06350 [Gemmatimonadaceae bacterium]|nr:hypothetical protein [Gemmatimonadaceae bacterium]